MPSIHKATVAGLDRELVDLNKELRSINSKLGQKTTIRNQKKFNRLHKQKVALEKNIRQTQTKKQQLLKSNPLQSLKRLQKNPELATMLMTEAVDLSQDNELGKQVSDLSASGSSPKFNLFKALDKNTQEHVLAALPPDTATSFVESAVNELAQNNNDAELIDLTGTLAQTRPEAFQAMQDTAMLSLAKTMEQSETPGMFTAKGKDPFGQVVQALSPSQLKTLAKTGQPTGKIAAALRQNNPAALLANVYDQNTTPEALAKHKFTESFVNAFKKDDGTMDWQALGKAGNKNPKLMAKVLNQLQQDPASNTLVKELGDLATAGESLEKGIVLAMAEQNNLEFMTSFDAMPASIQDLARDIILPTRPAQTAAPALPQKADETSQKGFAGPKMSKKLKHIYLG